MIPFNCRLLSVSYPQLSQTLSQMQIQIQHWLTVCMETCMEMLVIHPDIQHIKVTITMGILSTMVTQTTQTISSCSQVTLRLRWPVTSPVWRTTSFPAILSIKLSTTILSLPITFPSLSLPLFSFLVSKAFLSLLLLVLVQTIISITILNSLHNSLHSVKIAMI